MTTTEQVPDGTDDFAQTHATARSLVDAIRDLDQEALAALSPEKRQVQLEARQAMYDHFDRLWTDAKRLGLEPGMHEEWAGVAALRDLASALWTNAAPTGAEARPGSGI
jgi:hypothetical protein